MDRRTLLAAGLIALIRPATADAPRRARHLIVLRDVAAAVDVQRYYANVFGQDGWEVGRDLTIEFVNIAPEKDERALEQRLRAIVESRPTAILVETDLYIPILKRVAGDIPIVISNICCDDYIARIGWVDSIARPGANITGTLQPAIYDKAYQIAKQLNPKAKRLGILYGDSATALIGPLLKLMRDDANGAAKRLKLDITEIVYPENAPFATVEQMVRKARVDAIDAWVGSEDDTVRRLMGLFERTGIIGMWPDTSFVRAGGLMSVAANLGLGTSEALKIAGRVLRGTKPADIPLQIIRSSRLSLNLGVAKRMRLRIPDSVRTTAEVVVQ